MRLTETLVRVAALAAAATAGCGCSSNNVGGGTPNVQCPEPTITVTAAQACQIINDDYSVTTNPPGPTCTKLCAGRGLSCELPQSFVPRSTRSIQMRGCCSPTGLRPYSSVRAAPPR